MKKDLDIVKECFEYLIYKLPGCPDRNCKDCSRDKDIINKLNNSLLSLEINIMKDEKYE